jgi:hypothetical protein
MKIRKRERLSITSSMRRVMGLKMTRNQSKRQKIKLITRTFSN